MVNILKFLFNLYFELKYRFLYYFTKRTDNIIDIQNIHLINKDTKELHELNINQVVKKIGHEIIITCNNHPGYLLDVGYKWNNKYYIIQFLLDQNIDKIIFPFFSLNDIKMKVNNKIIMVEDNLGNIELNLERNKLINQYCGPIGDFYESKNFGIPLYNLYSLKYKDFLFRDVRLKMEDLFLNEYEVDGTDQNEIFQFKRNLDDTKLNKYSTNEDYILKTYDKFNLEWKKTIIEVFYWILGKKKNE
jgi:hypothetical protein